MRAAMFLGACAKVGLIARMELTYGNRSGFLYQFKLMAKPKVRE
jgi:hypothetical protein